MSFLDQVSVLILTFDEAPNIGRTLAALERFTDITVLDSGSTDATAEIVGTHPHARIVTRRFDSHAEQWNFGLAACGIERPWVLALDADYVLTHELVDEIQALDPDAVAGYRIRFNYCVFGRRLSAALYTPVVALYRRSTTRYMQDGHTQRAVVDGAVGTLSARIDHDDRKPLRRWLTSQASYARLEADLLLSTPWRSLRLPQKLRRLIVVSPWLVPLYILIFCRTLLDGRAGLFYAFQRGVAESILALELLERALKRSRTVQAGQDASDPQPPAHGRAVE